MRQIQTATAARRTAVSSVAFERYRSLRDVKLGLRGLNVLIGPNASGKSSVLDGLKLLHEAAVDRDFSESVHTRGGIIHLAWKGEDASFVRLRIEVSTGAGTFQWSVRLQRKEWGFLVHEEVHEVRRDRPPTKILDANDGKGWWWSSDSKKVQLRQEATACALAAASADASFPARDVFDFVRSWGFYDPSPILLRRAASDLEPSHLDTDGRNLAARLSTLRGLENGTFNRILDATRAILGMPADVDFRESEGRVYFVQTETGLKYPVHQVGASSGTLRILALMTALLGEGVGSLVGIEEPENYVHPAGLAAFAEHLLKARDRAQILITTHSPLLLDFLDDPEAVCVVRRDPEKGTVIVREQRPEAVREALEASGFRLGELHQTKGFGA